VLWLYLRDETGLLTSGGDVLHVAPERGIARRLRSSPGIRYLSVDLDPSRAMQAADLTGLGFPDGSFDVVICSHVLEHVPDDRAAMRELHRVLRPGGTAYLQHPVDEGLAHTIEDVTGEAVPSPERLSRFGHEEHLRTYGRDIRDRLEAAGFSVTVQRYAERLPTSVVRRHRLDAMPAARERPSTERIDDVYVCRR
jgi:SAM-dependent methyltransferase